MGRWAGRLLAFCVVALLLAGGWYVWVQDRFEAPGPAAVETTVILPKGAGVAGVAGALAEAGVIREPLLFRIGVRLAGRDRDLKAGEYAFPAGASARQVMEIVAGGRTVVHRLTVPEGLTSRQILELVAQAEALEGAVGALPPEGALLPETYHFSRGDSRAALVERMAADMQAAVAALWAGRDEGLPLDSPAQMVTLASIVEKETGVAAERPRIAGVFVNRLRQGMRLQSDPTVVYALTQGAGPLGRELTRADLAVDSPYNTYAKPGLPPGPIANPGRAALEAVAHPLATEELYFVADGTGGHAFARTLDEHNRNVAKWRAQQGGD